MSHIRVCCGLVFLMAATASALQAGTFVIQPDGTGDFQTIQAAIDAAAVGDTVALADGVFVGIGNKSLDYHGKTITVRSVSGDSLACVIDCEEAGRGFYFHSGEGADSRVQGLTVTRGRAPSGGGVVCVSGASPTFASCVFRDNATVGSDGANGGAVWCSYSSPTFVHCTFEGNSTVDYWGGGAGGGIYCWYPPSLLVEDCQFIDNVAAWGGGAGVFCHGGSGVVRNCAFRGNSWTGLVCVEAQLVISDSDFTGNAEGALLCDAASPEVRDCRFVGNTAVDWAGTLRCAYGASPSIVRCTFIGNAGAAGRGSGIDCYQGASPSISACTFYGTHGDVVRAELNSRPVIEHTIIVQSDSGAAVFCDGTSFPTLVCCNLDGNAGGDWVGCIADQYGVNGNFSADPLFCDPPSGDFALATDSPCAPENSPGECGLIGAWPVGCDVPMGAVEAPVAGGVLRLGSVWPTPAKDAVRIACVVPPGRIGAPVMLRIHDLQGRCVRSLELPNTSPGLNWFRWDGCGDDGLAQPAGTYFCSLNGNRAQDSRRVILIR
jgi:hypothetical protein